MPDDIHYQKVVQMLRPSWIAQYLARGGSQGDIVQLFPLDVLQYTAKVIVAHMGEVAISFKHAWICAEDAEGVADVAKLNAGKSLVCPAGYEPEPQVLHVPITVEMLQYARTIKHLSQPAIQ